MARPCGELFYTTRLPRSPASPPPASACCCSARAARWRRLLKEGAWSCSRLDEVRQALTAGHWPQASAPDLHAHVETCGRCAQEVLITQHLQLARAEAVASARPGTPSLLWLRAQARRRTAALERAGRPLAAAQIFALVLVAATIFGLVASHWRSLLDHTLSAPDSPVFSLTTMVADWGMLPLLAAVAILTTLGGVVVYLTTERQITTPPDCRPPAVPSPPARRAASIGETRFPAIDSLHAPPPRQYSGRGVGSCACPLFSSHREFRSLSHRPLVSASKRLGDAQKPSRLSLCHAPASAFSPDPQTDEKMNAARSSRRFAGSVLRRRPGQCAPRRRLSRPIQQDQRCPS